MALHDRRTMTIEFNCPKCGALIAFDSKHVGKCAKCLTCGQRFFIPAESFQKPKKVEPEPQPKEDPIPGFYRAVFIDSVKVFFNPANVTTLAFVIAVVCFKFFLADACCLNFISYFVIWGWLFGFYLNVVSHTAIDDDLLPEIEIGTSITFILYVIGPFLTFAFTLFLVEWPFLLGLSLVQDQGITFGNLFWGSTGLHRLLQALLLGGLFLFPAAILAVSAGGTSSLLRPDYLLAPLPRAFLPYLTTVALLVAVCLLEMHTTQFEPKADLKATLLNLAHNLLVQVIAIFAMRSIGLYYRHYGCYFRW